MHALSATIDRVIRFIGQCASVGILLMTLITFVVVVLRYGFGTGWIALQESVMYLHALVFMLGAAYTLRDDGHVRVDIFYRKFSEKQQAMVNIAGTLLLLFPVCIFIFAMSWDYVMKSWQLLESSKEAGGLPLVFVLKSLIPAFCALMLLQGVSDLIRYAAVITQRKEST
ncbi:TRAP transporter small permease subunit [Alteromonas facilis]|uniref:TRAP transporter small permease subunit n=1 Tax=Alteromonas facilis TaxID=2048004 RepID=UPI001F0C6DBF|nr:TRAP transporter small permease subunit [Alteromonas facilis]